MSQSALVVDENSELRYVDVSTMVTDSSTSTALDTRLSALETTFASTSGQPGEIIDTASGGKVLQIVSNGETYYLPAYIPGLQPPTTQVLWSAWLQDANGDNPLIVTGGGRYSGDSNISTTAHPILLPNELFSPNAYIAKNAPGASFQILLTGTYIASGQLSFGDIGTTTNAAAINFYIDNVKVGVQLNVGNIGNPRTFSSRNAACIPYSMQFSAMAGQIIEVRINAGSQEPYYVTGRQPDGTFCMSALTLSVVSI